MWFDSPGKTILGDLGAYVGSWPVFEMSSVEDACG